jgi:hypothetical protein
MGNLVFVQTSKGYINLALVFEVELSEKVMRFTSGSSWSAGDESIQPNYVELPLKEGEQIMSRLIGSEYLLTES